MRTLSADAEARKAKTLADINNGKCGFLARIMEAEGNAECREIGRLADAELRQRDEIIRRLEWKVQMLESQFDRLKGSRP